jgi:hypothetical protein
MMGARRLLVALLTASATATACGGSSPTSPPVTTPPVTPQAAVTFTGSVAPYAIVSERHTPTVGGSQTVTLTWTASADLDLYVTAASCTGYPPDACTLLARSTSSTGTREEVTVTVVAGTPVLLWVDNFSTTATAAYTVVVRGT